jgi:HEAT repeat protein
MGCRDFLLQLTLLMGLSAQAGCLPVTPALKPNALASPSANASTNIVPARGLDFSILGQLLAMPTELQRPIWQTWALDNSDEARQQQAIAYLSHRGSPSDIGVLFQGVVNGKRRTRAIASRGLMDIGPQLSDHARNALVSILMREPDASAGALTWALVLAGDARVYERALYLYRQRLLSRVQYFDGRFALDPAILGALNLARTLSLARDADPDVRRLVAATCSRVAQPECAPWLVQFARDVQPEVRIAALSGLAKLGTRETTETLNSVLRNADGPWRNRFLESLRDEAGLLGLVAALSSIPEGKSETIAQATQVFELIDSQFVVPRRSMLDPRGSDALADYMDHAQEAQFRLRAAQILAQMGDLRSLPALAQCLHAETSTTYPGRAQPNPTPAEDDPERVVCARLISDLADLHSEQLGDIRKATENALLGWLQRAALPHTEGMRALVKLESQRGFEAIARWASPRELLPKGNQELSGIAKWWIAQSALRYLGLVRGEKGQGLLENSLQRRPKDINVSMTAVSHGYNASLGRALRSIGIGAAQGIGEAGRARSSDLLMRFAMDTWEHEESRFEACRALAWVSNSTDARQRILGRARGIAGASEAPAFNLICLLESLALRGDVQLQDDLLAFLRELIARPDRISAFAVARALGRTVLSVSSEQMLLTLLHASDDQALPATLALLLGGRSEVAILAALKLLERSAQAQADLQQAYYHSFDYLTDEDLERDSLFRWVKNAKDVEHFSPRGVHLQWTWELLGQQLRNLEFDKGPHSLTRTVFRNRLYQQALGGDHFALDTLLLAGERGMLFALRDTPGEASFAAYRAYYRFLRPWQMRELQVDTAPQNASGRN